MAGVSAWLILDSQTRKLQRVDRLLKPVPTVERRRALPNDPDKVEICEPDVEYPEFLVHYSDLDVNGHVNNGRYIGWLLDSYPPEFHRERGVSELEINFVGEGAAEDKILVRSQEKNDGDLRSILRRKDSEELCRARIRWRQSA